MGPAKLKGKSPSRIRKAVVDSTSGGITRETKGMLPPSKVANASAILKLLSEPIRLNMLLVLSDGEASVDGLSKLFDQTRGVVSHHLALLRYFGLIVPRRQGKENLFSLAAEGRRIVDVFGEILPLALAGRNPDDVVEPALLEDVGGFVDDPEEWFRTPNEVFEGRKPIDLLGTPDEPRLRNRIEAAKLGMFS